LAGICAAKRPGHESATGKSMASGLTHVLEPASRRPMTGKQKRPGESPAVCGEKIH
jgi:hypothetical protein